MVETETDLVKLCSLVVTSITPCPHIVEPLAFHASCPAPASPLQESQIVAYFVQDRTNSLE